MDNVLDFENVLQAAETYSIATGIHCTVIDSEGKVISGSQGPTFCKLCKQLGADDTDTDKCSDIHLYGIYQAERFGGKYIYFCALSLMHWVSPLIVDGSVQGGLVCGPVLTYNPEDFILNEYSGKLKNPQDQLVRFRDHLDSLPKVTPSRVKSLSDQLFMTAAFLSDSPHKMLIFDESVKQQSEIAGYIHHIKTMECNPEKKLKYPIEKEKELLNQISNADIPGARKTLNEILGNVFFSSGNDFDTIRSRVLELVVLLSRAAMEGGADVEQIFGMNYQYLKKIHSFTNIDDLSFWLTNIMGRFSDLVFKLKSVKHIDIIYKALQYMSSNYAEKITLDEVADEVALSPAYFSKIFKEQTGSSFSRYLNKLRIEKGKLLLRNSDLSLVDIAGMLGYEDQSYFSKVFKKLTGSSPGRYRLVRGLVETENHEIHT